MVKDSINFEFIPVFLGNLEEASGASSTVIKIDKGMNADRIWDRIETAIFDEYGSGRDLNFIIPIWESTRLDDYDLPGFLRYNLIPHDDEELWKNLLEWLWDNGTSEIPHSHRKEAYGQYLEMMVDKDLISPTCKIAYIPADDPDYPVSFSFFSENLRKLKWSGRLNVLPDICAIYLRDVDGNTEQKVEDLDELLTSTCIGDYVNMNDFEDHCRESIMEDANGDGNIFVMDDGTIYQFSA